MNSSEHTSFWELDTETEIGNCALTPGFDVTETDWISKPGDNATEVPDPPRWRLPQEVVTTVFVMFGRSLSEHMGFRLRW